MNLDAIPTQLKTIDRWVTWRYVQDPKRPDKPKKMPFNPKTGKPADSTNADTWASFDVAVRAAQSRRHDGIGFVFVSDDQMFGGDLDDCLTDGALAPWAARIVADFATYTEISPSGNGVKFFGVGDLTENIKRFGDKIPEDIKPADAPGGVELYSSARFFTVTGQHLDGTPSEVRSVNGALHTLVSSLKPSEPAHTAEPTARATVDDEYLRVWAERIVDRAEQTLSLAPEGSLHDTRIAMARLCGGLIPHGLATADDLERRLYAARVPNAHHTTEREAIRDGLAMGEQKALEKPEPPQQPLFDAEGYAVCPAHKTRLPAAKNGNGYKCHERDTTTASGWCDFWWKGNGYIPPRETTEPMLIGGEIISQAPTAIEARPTTHIKLYNIKGLRALPPVSWLIEGEIPAGMTTVICGPSEGGKSFFAVDRALRVARANPDRVVVYIAPEGGSGYRARVDAWLNYFGGEEPPNLLFILQTVTLLNPQTLAELVSIIRPLNPVMVVIDTLARSIIGGDENSAKDVGQFFYHTDLIREATDSAIVVVHHTGRSGSYRGSSALYGSADSWIDFSNNDGLITVECGKAKDWERFAPRYLRMAKSGESVVLLPADQVSQRDGGLTEGQRKILETLVLDIFTEPGARRAEIATATGINELTLYRVLSRLKRDGMIAQSKKGDPYFITSAGRDAIRDYHRQLKHQREQEQLADDEARHDAELANSQGTGNQLAANSSHQLATSTNLHLYKRDASLQVASESELFPETESVTIDRSASPPARASSAAPGGLDWEYLRGRYAAGDERAIRLHCTLCHQDAEMVMEQLRAGH